MRKFINVPEIASDFIRIFKFEKYICIKYSYTDQFKEHLRVFKQKLFRQDFIWVFRSKSFRLAFIRYIFGKAIREDYVYELAGYPIKIKLKKLLTTEWLKQK